MLLWILFLFIWEKSVWLSATQPVSSRCDQLGDFSALNWIFVKLIFFVIISIWTLKMVEYFWKLKIAIYHGKSQPWSDLEGKPHWRRQENNHGRLFKSWQQYREKLVRWLCSIQVAYKEERSLDLFWFWYCLIKSCVHKGWNFYVTISQFFPILTSLGLRG